MFLKPVALSEYEVFAKGHFEKAGKQIADDVVKAIYDRFDGTTWYLQKVLNQLFATKDSVVVSDVDEAVQQIINQNEEAYKDVLYQLTAKKAECSRIDAFELLCWRRLLRVPWTARRSNQSILKEISPEYSLEGLMLKLKLQYFGN